MPSILARPRRLLRPVQQILAIAALILVSGIFARQTAAAAEQWNALSTPDPARDQAIFVFGGFYQDDSFGDVLNPFGAPSFNNDTLIGFGYQQMLVTDPDGFSFGGEIGVAGRFADPEISAEIWTGLVGRYGGFVIADALRVSPAFTIGLSAVTGKVSTEAAREADSGDSADLLFYLGPELNFSLPERPDIELFTRLHYRSGAWGTLADMDGSDASAIGVRLHF